MAQRWAQAQEAPFFHPCGSKKNDPASSVLADAVLHAVALPLNLFPFAGLSVVRTVAVVLDDWVAAVQCMAAAEKNAVVVRGADGVVLVSVLAHLGSVMEHFFLKWAPLNYHPSSACWPSSISVVYFGTKF